MNNNSRARGFGQVCSIALAALVTGMTAAPAWARDHVLIMTISNYPLQPLEGVKFDAGNARKIAERLGYDTSQALVYKDSQLSAAGLKTAIAQLTPLVQRNDRVFIYYSGHGFSQRQGNQCVQTLVGQDGGLVSTDDLNQQLDAIKLRTSDVFVLIDACHSGGLGEIAITRSASQRNTDDAAAPSSGGLSAKVYQPKSGEACGVPVNFAKAWDAPGSAVGVRASFPRNNFTFVAAANEREVALDDNQRGGLATLSLLRCLEGGVPDLDGSGAVSTRELVSCAQAGINADVPALNARRGTRWTAHTLESYGNSERALSAVKTLAVASPSVAASVPSTDNLSTKPLTQDAKRALAAFSQVVAGSNGNWSLEVEMPAATKMGEKAAVHVSSFQPGFLTIFYVGSDGKDIKPLASNVAIDARGRTLLGHIPIEDCPGGCPGDNVFLFVVSATQLASTSLIDRARASGAMPITTEALTDIQCTTQSAKRNAGALQLNGSPCGLAKRNAGVLQPAKGAVLDGYAARLLTVRGY